MSQLLRTIADLEGTIADLEGTADVLDHHNRGAHQPTATSIAPPTWA